MDCKRKKENNDSSTNLLGLNCCLIIVLFSQFVQTSTCQGITKIDATTFKSSSTKNTDNSFSSTMNIEEVTSTNTAESTSTEENTFNTRSTFTYKTTSSSEKKTSDEDGNLSPADILVLSNGLNISDIVNPSFNSSRDLTLCDLLFSLEDNGLPNLEISDCKLLFFKL
ncbi:hypothetical protein C0J52_07888 [Blattella germanica]|nr:hypothetical protein C0J52_07888 [Blattella germanica]